MLYAGINVLRGVESPFAQNDSSVGKRWCFSNFAGSNAWTMRYSIFLIPNKIASAF